MKKLIIVLAVIASLSLVGFYTGVLPGATNFDRLVLGEDNFGEDPNTTADITGQNDEYLSNYTNGEWNIGSAALNVGVLVAGIDSFTTTAVVDTLALSGVAPGNIFVFTEYTPAHSTAIDTVFFSYICKTDTVIVSRTTPKISGAAYKSAGIYSYVRLK